MRNGACLVLLCLAMTLGWSGGVWGANILGLYSTFSPSHLIVHMSMMRALADQGHNVTVVCALPPKLKPHENITVVLAPFSEERKTKLNEFMKTTAKGGGSFVGFMLRSMTSTNEMMLSQYEFLFHPKVKALYEEDYPVKFDLIVLGYVMNDYQLGVAAKLQIPVILAWVGIPFTMVDDAVGNIYDPAYVPSLSVTLEPGQKSFGFVQRIRNTITWLLFQGINMGVDYKVSQYYSDAFGNDPSLPSYQELKRRVSLLFYNYHSHSEGPIRPTVPQSVEIGGIQIKEQPDPLPKELAEFLDNASEGAIFFSLGTNVKPSYIAPHVLEAIYQVLARQPLRVVWKWEEQIPKPGNSSNIYFHHWLPQDDILSHPKLKLFITHAGKGGVAEAQYHGVPMLAIPIFGDQPKNAELMVASGFGLSLDVVTITEQQLEQSIHELLHNPIYSENVKQFSALYRDRPLTARQSVVYWTEYVLRHKGAYHLQSPRIHMDFVAKNNLDVFTLLFTLLVLILVIVVSIIRCLCRRVCRSKRRVYESQPKLKVK